MSANKGHTVFHDGDMRVEAEIHARRVMSYFLAAQRMPSAIQTRLSIATVRLAAAAEEKKTI